MERRRENLLATHRYEAAKVADNFADGAPLSGIRKKFEDKVCGNVIRASSTRRRRVDIGTPPACDDSMCSAECNCEDYGWGSPLSCSNCGYVDTGCSSGACYTAYNSCLAAKKSCEAGTYVKESAQGLLGSDGDKCEYIRYKIEKKKISVDLAKDLPTVKLSDIIPSTYGSLLRLLGTDAEFRVHQTKQKHAPRTALNYWHSFAD